MGGEAALLSGRVRWGRYAYLAVAGLFTCCVFVQVFVAGMAVFDGAANWALHRTVAHLVEPLVLLLFVLAFVGNVPRGLKLAPLALLALFTVQYATASLLFGSTVAALHPVSGVVICLVAVWSVSRAWTVVSTTRGHGTP